MRVLCFDLSGASPPSSLCCCSRKRGEVSVTAWSPVCSTGMTLPSMVVCQNRVNKRTEGSPEAMCNWWQQKHLPHRISKIRKFSNDFQQKHPLVTAVNIKGSLTETGTNALHFVFS